MGMKKPLIILGGLAVSIITLYKLLNNREPEAYSTEWIKNLSPQDLEKKREEIRQLYCTSGIDEKASTALKKILDLFDKIKSERDWAGKEFGFPVHKEHGWYLPSD